MPYFTPGIVVALPPPGGAEMTESIKSTIIWSRFSEVAPPMATAVLEPYDDPDTGERVWDEEKYLLWRGLICLNGVAVSALLEDTIPPGRLRCFYHNHENGNMTLHNASVLSLWWADLPDVRMLAS